MEAILRRLYLGTIKHAERVMAIWSTGGNDDGGAFAALRQDGSVTVWGSANNGGEDPKLSLYKLCFQEAMRLLQPCVHQATSTTAIPSSMPCGDIQSLRCKRLHNIT